MEYNLITEKHFTQNVLLILWLLCFHIPIITAQNEGSFQTEWTLPHEIDNNESITYWDMIAFLERLAVKHPEFYLDTFGTTDAGFPLHLAMLADKPYKNGHEAKAAGKVILWINNGIHPGEPEGMDATIQLIRDYLLSGQSSELIKDVVVLILPVYNVGGMLNRNSTSRVNQNGPNSYGFRGNARNLDLNRDFIKTDSKNAKSFNRLFTQWLPDVFLDNHTSNGADYQHVMTLIATQHNKLNGPKGTFLQSTFVPALYKGMVEKQSPMCPYVSTRGGLPENGIYAFNDTPRYSSGYAALFGALSFMAETHMFKPFIERLESNYKLMEVILDAMINYKEELIRLRHAQTDYFLGNSKYPLKWNPDPMKSDSIWFLGYTSGMKESQVTGQKLRFFDRDKPWQKNIPYFNYFLPDEEVEIPEYYIIPQAYSDILERLLNNQIEVQILQKDTLLPVEFYIIDDIVSVKQPYEGHFRHQDLQLSLGKKNRLFRKGDYLVKTRQDGIRYIMEVLEPKAEDSFFRWNFFDAILQRKEWYSEYIFDGLALELLEQDEDLRKAFESEKVSNPDFAASSGAQLRFIYERSPHRDSEYKVYPVFRYWGEDF